MLNDLEPDMQLSLAEECKWQCEAAARAMRHFLDLMYGSIEDSALLFGAGKKAQAYELDGLMNPIREFMNDHEYELEKKCHELTEAIETEEKV